MLSRALLYSAYNLINEDKQGNMSLVADYSDSQSSSCDEASDDCNDQKEKKQKVACLPSASSLLAKKTGDVFDNRYQQEERAKKASLEQHVKMVENDEHMKMKNGKKICWNHRKGQRCRFGSKCQFAHDSDLVIETTKPSLSETKVQKNPYNDALTKDSKRKRPGLGDSLIPSKKVLKSYKEQQQKP